MAEDMGKIDKSELCVNTSRCAASVLSSYRFTQWLATHSTQISIFNSDLLYIGHATIYCRPFPIDHAEFCDFRGRIM